jgi:hypothetical protein
VTEKAQENQFWCCRSGFAISGRRLLASEVPRYLVDDGEPRRGGVFKMQIVLNSESQSIYAIQYTEEESALEMRSREQTHLICNCNTCQTERDFCLQRKMSAACFRNTPSAAGVSFLEIDLY